GRAPDRRRGPAPGGGGRRGAGVVRGVPPSDGRHRPRRVGRAPEHERHRVEGVLRASHPPPASLRAPGRMGPPEHRRHGGADADRPLLRRDDARAGGEGGVRAPRRAREGAALMPLPGVPRSRRTALFVAGDLVVFGVSLIVAVVLSVHHDIPGAVVGALPLWYALSVGAKLMCNTLFRAYS